MTAPTSAPSIGPPDPADATVTAALRRLHDRLGWLPDAALRDLADRLGEPLHRLEEVVSFFPHFRRTRPPYVELLVCRDMTCHLNGAAGLAQGLAGRLAADSRVEVKTVSCLGRCDRPVAVCANRFAAAAGGAGDDVHDAFYLNRRSVDDLAAIAAALAAGRPAPPPDRDIDGPQHCGPWRIDVYAGKPTYDAVRAACRQLRAADDPATARGQLDVIPKLELSGLRGMGGAGVPAGKKWKDVRAAAGADKYIICNADESEPATFKDRELLLRAPHLVVEGVILAGLACGGTRGYIYIRHEYPEQIAAVRAAIADAERQGVCGKNVRNTGIDFWVSVYVSPGGYVCGEQSALIEAIEGKRAQPRNRPPELATNGLFDKPTLVNNVETFAWVPGIVRHTVLPAAGRPAVNWYADLGRPEPDGKGRGMRFFSISGDVTRPGVYEVPIGTPVRDLMAAAGGLDDGPDDLLAVAPSGPSGGFVPRWGLKHPTTRQRIDLYDAELDIDYFRGIPAALGAGLVVYARNRGAGLADQAANATQFFRGESCGKCVPCRVGCDKLAELAVQVRTARDAGWLRDTRAAVRALDRAMELTSICGLGQVAAKPLLSVLKYFPPVGIDPTMADMSAVDMAAVDARKPRL